MFTLWEIKIFTKEEYLDGVNKIDIELFCITNLFQNWVVLPFSPHVIETGHRITKSILESIIMINDNFKKWCNVSNTKINNLKKKWSQRNKGELLWFIRFKSYWENGCGFIYL